MITFNFKKATSFVKTRIQLTNYLSDFLRAFKLLWYANSKLSWYNLIMQVVQAILPILSLYFLKQLIETASKKPAVFSDIIEVIIYFALVQLILAAANQASGFLNIIQQQKLSDELSGKVLEKAADVDYEYYENAGYHNTLHLVQQQSIYKIPLLLNYFNSVVSKGMSVAFLLAFFLILNVKFVLLFILLSAPLAIIKWYSGFAITRLERQFVPQQREAAYLHQITTGVTFAKELRVWDLAAGFIRKFKAIHAMIYQKKRSLIMKLTIYSLIAEAAEIIAMVFIFAMMTSYIVDGLITLGLFVIYITGFQRLQTTFRAFLQALVDVFQQRLFLKDLFIFLDIKSKHFGGAAKPFPDLKNGLEIDHLSFKYPGAANVILKDISIRCSPGQVIAIVGENGSGKSTLVKLLARLYESGSGDMTIGGVKVQDIDMQAYRKGTAFMFQDFEKYFFSVEENISLGSVAEESRVKEAAKAAGADGFINELSGGYQTRMGRLFEGGEQLSGGQWQKLALSRIFYKDAGMVVMDEVTSYLDAVAEAELFKNIRAHAENRLVILISHRLYNLKQADYIYVLDKGLIAEEGKFDELVNANGIFNKMYEAQQL